jgi:hypothetical protein
MPAIRDCLVCGSAFNSWFGASLCSDACLKRRDIEKVRELEVTANASVFGVVAPMGGGKTTLCRRARLDDRVWFDPDSVNLTMPSEVRAVLRVLRKDRQWDAHDEIWCSYLHQCFRRAERSADYTVCFAHHPTHLDRLAVPVRLVILPSPKVLVDRIMSRLGECEPSEAADAIALALLNLASIKGWLEANKSPGVKIYVPWATEDEDDVYDRLVRIVEGDNG